MLSKSPTSQISPPPESELAPKSELGGQSSGYVPALDGLRAFAVFSVVAYHCRLLPYPGGLFGVDLFFALSGFLITGLLLKEFNTTASISITTFYARRARRLLPALLVLVASFTLAAWLLGWNWHQVLKEAALSTFGVSNWARAMDYRLPKTLGHLWSLSVEIQFCLLWAPLCYLVLRKWRSAEALFIFCIILTLFVELHRRGLVSSEASIKRLYNGTDVRLNCFAIGGAVRALLMGERQLSQRARAVCSKYALWFGIVGLSVHLYLSSTVSIRAWSHTAFLSTAIALSCAAMIIGASMAPNALFARVLSLPPLRYIGQISYGIYLWHYLLLKMIHLPGLGKPERSLLCITASVIAGTLSYYLVERHFLKRGAAPTSKLPPIKDAHSKEVEEAANQ